MSLAVPASFITPFWFEQLIILLILIPFLSAILLFALPQNFYVLKSNLSLSASWLLLFCNIFLSWHLAWPKNGYAYALGGAGAPFTISLVFDKLSSLMLLISNIIVICALLFARNYWERVGYKFHAFMHFLLMGINGVFLTADLFNLFVFFELMLAASYGLALCQVDSESGRFSFNYIAINLLVSLFFLASCALFYNIAGGLNFASIMLKLAKLKAEDSLLAYCAIGLFALVLFSKMALWPLNFWLMPLYKNLPAPIICVFILLTKLGFYLFLRFSFLLWPLDGALFKDFGQFFCLNLALFSLFYGCIILLAQGAILCFLCGQIIISSGLLLSASSFFSHDMLSAMLYYLCLSSFNLAALALLSEWLEPLPINQIRSANPSPSAGVIYYIICAMLFIGMPPLSGFWAKFLLARALLWEHKSVDWPGFLFISALLLTSLASFLALLAYGMRVFFSAKKTSDKAPLKPKAQHLAIVILLSFSLSLSFALPWALAYFSSIISYLENPLSYFSLVLQNY